MNTTQLRKLGVPDECLASAIGGIQKAAGRGGSRGKEIKERIAQILAEPSAHEADPHFGPFAKDLI